MTFPPPRLSAWARSCSLARKFWSETEQERAQPPPLAAGGREGLVLQQVDEERLGQILRIAGSVPPPPQKGVQRWPVGLAEACQRLLGRFRRLALRGEQDHAPVGGLESGPALLQGSRDVFHLTTNLPHRQRIRQEQ